VLKQYTFADGLKLPQGETIATPVVGVHMDEKFYDNPHEFDGFRFSKMREQKGESAKHHSVNTSTEFLAFGHGIHAWYCIDDVSLLIQVLEDFSR
jgi:cytochrome P450